MRKIENWGVSLRDEPEAFVLWTQCPRCLRLGDRAHTVHPDGAVTPAFECPKCTFRGLVKLEGWAEIAQSSLSITYPQPLAASRPESQ